MTDLDLSSGTLECIDGKPALSLAHFVALHADQIAEYIQVYLAYPMRQGDMLHITTERSPWGEIEYASDHGYLISGINPDGDEITAFVSQEDFQLNATDMHDAPYALARRPLPSGARLSPSDCLIGGYFMEVPNTFISQMINHYEMHARFDVPTAADPLAGVRAAYNVVAHSGKPPFKGIILGQDETLVLSRAFHTKNGLVQRPPRRETLAAGSFIYEEPTAQDGYGVACEKFSRFVLRRPKPAGSQPPAARRVLTAG